LRGRLSRDPTRVFVSKLDENPRPPTITRSGHYENPIDSKTRADDAKQNASWYQMPVQILETRSRRKTRRSHSERLVSYSPNSLWRPTLSFLNIRDLERTRDVHTWNGETKNEQKRTT